VQVRENALQGTRLRLRPDLAVKTLSGWDVQVACRTGRSSALGLDLASSTLDGRTTVAGPVLFNGATLAGGTPLRTRVRFPDFLRLTVLYHRVLARPGGGRIRVRGVAFWRGFGQDERSAEDGSRTRITAAGLRLTAGVSW
jgi:hypothetical protein